MTPVSRSCSDPAASRTAPVPALCAALVGDVVHSRRSADRRGLHLALSAAMEAVNTRLEPVTPLRITMGDDYQGAFATVGDAITATMLMRLALAPVHEVRHGIGWGALSVLAESPRVEDGPAWWAARAAIEQVEAGERRSGRSVRTAYAVAEAMTGAQVARAPDPAAVNAALTLRDVLVDGLSERSVSVLRGLIDGRTQRELAEELGITSSAVSQRVRGDGLAAVVTAHRMLAEVA